MPSPMPSPSLPPQQLSSSHRSSSGNLSTSSRTGQQHRKTSADKLGLVPRTDSSSSLQRTTSGKSNSSTGAASKTQKHHHHHAHVAHTSASKHHRTTSFGHRVPSYGKGLNKLTALTAVNPDDGPREHLSIHSIIDRAPGGTSMQRSMSEGNTLLRTRERRPSSGSSGSLHTARPKVRRPVTHPAQTTKSASHRPQHVSFSTHHSSDEEEDEALVHRKSTEIVESPQQQPALIANVPPVSPVPPPKAAAPPPVAPPVAPKSALREGLAASAPKFLHKSLSQITLVPPKVSITNAVAKDIANPSTSVEHVMSAEHAEGTPSSEPQVAPSSNPTSHFISSTPPSRTPRTPDLEISGVRRNQSSTSLATTADQTIQLTTPSHGKLTRTQQKLLLQRASTQPPVHPLNLSNAGYSSPSLGNTAQMESGADYFSPLPAGTQSMFTPGVQANMPYDVKVAREYDRIARELTNAKRFGNPISDALQRLQERVNPVSSSKGLTKKQSAFGLNVAWKRSPDKVEAATSTGHRPRVDLEEDGLFAGERKSKVKEVMRKLWYEEVDISKTGDENDDGDETLVGMRRHKGKATASRSH